MLLDDCIEDDIVGYMWELVLVDVGKRFLIDGFVGFGKDMVVLFIRVDQGVVNIKDDQFYLFCLYFFLYLGNLVLVECLGFFVFWRGQIL